jgi:hypothetical protein
MTPASDQQKHPWQDVGLITTNPVYVAERLLASLDNWFRSDLFLGSSEGPTRFSRCLRTLAERGGRVPGVAMERFRLMGALPAGFQLSLSEERTGVLGLVVDRNTDVAFVLPLRPKRLGCAPSWDVDRSLPFSEDDVMDLLVQFMQVGVPDATAIPERLAFRFGNALRHRVRGNSMTVVAALAVLDDLGGRMSHRLRSAVALVEPGADGSLVEVESIRPKLAAAFREHDRLSLVIAREACSELSSLYRGRVDAIWEVRTVSDLARRLGTAGLLGPLIDIGTAPLGLSELVRVQNRLRWLIDRDHAYAEAADLADRVRHCKKGSPIDPGVIVEVGRLSAAACRHHGRFTDATQLSREVFEQVCGLGPGTSEDEEADATAEYAAALFDGHEFHKIPPLLERLAAEAWTHPRVFRSLTRIKMWNTLARAQIILGATGWEELLRRSMQLTCDLSDLENNKRTRSYLVHGLLRYKRVSEARSELRAALLAMTPASPSPWDGFQEANAARLNGEVWSHPALDASHPADTIAVPKHAYGLYFQATGRQQARELRGALGRIDRLTRAAEFFRAEAGQARLNICALFAAALELEISGLNHDAGRWRDTLGQIHDFIWEPSAPSLREYYAPCLDALPEEPDSESAEHFLGLIPYF